MHDAEDFIACHLLRTPHLNTVTLVPPTLLKVAPPKQRGIQTLQLNLLTSNPSDDSR
jgi:hypothetical protein